MKSETVQALVTARMLFDKSRELCLTDDKYSASAGLVILEDAVELILCACITELEIDDKKSIDFLTFHDLIREVRDAGKTVIRARDLKALHAARNSVKHHGNLAEPSTVRKFFDSAIDSMNGLLQQTVGKDLQNVMLHEVIKEGEAKDYIQEACKLMEKRDFFWALINIRKAIYVEIEEEYSIEQWANISKNNDILKRQLVAGGRKAPWHTKNKEWIDKNVNDPFDYIQLDDEKVRLDLLEWGVTTEDFWNLWRLTPQVFRFKKSQKWVLKGELKYFKEGASEANARYCLDKAILLIMKKQKHYDLSRRLSDYEPWHQLKVQIKQKTTLYEKASKNSKEVQQLQKGTVLNATYIVTSGLSENSKFIYILHKDKDETLIKGYVDSNVCEILEDSGKKTE
jgi:hypothetical protein